MKYIPITFICLLTFLSFGCRTTLPLSKEDIVQQKLKSMIIPNVEFKEADIRDVMAFFDSVSVALDKSNDGGPKKGVHIYYDWRKMNWLDMTGVRKKPIKITFCAENISLFDAITTISISKMANLEYTIESYVVITPKPTTNAVQK